MTEHADLRFPSGFLWGAATSAYQVEGNCSKNDWWAWEEIEGFIQDGSRSGIACDHYNRFDEDFALAQQLGHNAARISIEWSRIEPEEGRWDMAEVDHYRRVLESIHRHGLTPLVTLHHFTNPLWMANKGGWIEPSIVDHVSRYAAFISGQLGELVPKWDTINEPMVLVNGMHIYLRGDWQKTTAVARHMLKAHAAMYQAIHAATSHNPQVSIVHAMPYMMPENPDSEADREASRLRDQFAVEYILAGIESGTIGPPFGDGEDVPGLKGAWDAIGINYYTRSIAAAGDSPAEMRGRVPEGAETTLHGDEVYPEGLYHGIMRLANYGRPIYVTENGISTLDDGQRNRYLLRHLQQAHRAISDGADLRCYMYWSLLDNFEWMMGYSQKFGMCALEPGTLNRLPKPAAYIYRDIATSNRISAAQLKAHLG